MPRFHLAVAAAAATVGMATTAAVPADAQAYRVGIGDQNAAMFDDSRYDALQLRRVRYIVPWDVLKHDNQLGEVDLFVQKAQENGAELLVSFTARRGCFNNGRYSRKSVCRAPSKAAFRRAFRKFRARYPSVRVYSPWNEANHVSQPTRRSPRRAAQYYDVVRRACKRCTVVAADVLDQSDAASWLRRFMRATRGKPRIWGLHNYASVNRRRSAPTTRVLRTVPGQVWLTETGGIYKFGRSFPRSERRAASRIRTMFSLANRYGKRRRGLRSKIGRVYLYKWYGEPAGARFDAGLINLDGTARKSYHAFKRGLRGKPR